MVISPARRGVRLLEAPGLEWLSSRPIDGKYHTYPERAAAGLWTIRSDLARFTIELQEAGAGTSHRIISQDLASAMLTPQFGETGLGIMIAGAAKAACFHHGGSNAGFRCQLEATLETGLRAVVMTNSDTGGPRAQELLRSTAREYDWPPIQAEK